LSDTVVFKKDQVL